MLEILLEIYSQGRSKYVAFKGGTMLYFFYNLDRFSTDLDFDILDIDKKDYILSEVKKIISNKLMLKKETKGKSLHRLIYSYGQDEHNIKIECNTRVGQNNQYERKSLLGKNIYCMTKESSFANKLLALSERVANRDVYDVVWMNKQGRTFSEAVITARGIHDMNKFFLDLKKHVSKNFSNNTILGQLGLVLSEKQKIDVKKHLLSDLNQLIDIRILSYN